MDKSEFWGQERAVAATAARIKIKSPSACRVLRRRVNVFETQGLAHFFTTGRRRAILLQQLLFPTWAQAACFLTIYFARSCMQAGIVSEKVFP